MGVVIDEGVEMSTRDGVMLVADVYRPDADGAWPTLLHRTPYDRTDPTLVAAIVADPLWLARQGFAVVVQDVRGRFASGGDLDFTHQERDDGYDAVEWAAAQPWSDGRVGIYGSSYHAITTYGALAARPPHLCAALAMIGSTAQRATVRPGGTFEIGFLTLYALGQSMDAIRRLDVSEDEKTDLRRRVVAAASAPAATVGTLPLTDVDVLSDPRVAPYWREWVAGEPRDRPMTGPIDVPLLQVASYRDFMAPTMFTLARSLGGDDRHRLVAGPWAHGGVYTGHTGARVLPGTPGGVGTWGPLVAAWFDVHLRGGDGSAFPAAARWLGGGPVRYYVGGENRWTSAAVWPPPGTETTWHLTSDGDARTATGTGRLLPPDSVTAPQRAQAGSPDSVMAPQRDRGGAPDSVMAPQRDRGGAPDSVMAPQRGRGGAPDSVMAPQRDRGGAPDSVMAPQRDGVKGRDSWVADPRDPFPTCGGAFPAGVLGPDGIQDQRAVDHRPDVLVYTSDALGHPVTVAGAPEFVAHLSSTAPDADVCVTLVDVEPDGFAVPVAEGAQRARYRLGGREDWLGDEPVGITVALHDTAHTFRTGHRIRLMVAGASWPRRSRNLHTTTVPELGTLDEAVAATHTLHHAHSRLVLPSPDTG